MTMQPLTIPFEQELPNLTFELYNPVDQTIIEQHLRDWRGHWVVLFFYPADFTFVCPTELDDLQHNKKLFDALGNVKIVSVSADTTYSHKVWVENEKLLKDFSFLMASDRNQKISQTLGVLNTEAGNALRATCIVSPTGILKSVEIVPDHIGRSSKECIRKLKALKYVYENPDTDCPASWDSDMPVLHTTIKNAGHVGDTMQTMFKPAE